MTIQVYHQLWRAVKSFLSNPAGHPDPSLAGDEAGGKVRMAMPDGGADAF